MPSTYAHYRFGKSVEKKLSGNEKRIIRSYPELYFIGLHGPDILFYYRPLNVNEVNQIGFHMHDCSGKDFFLRAAEIIRKHAKDPNGNEPYLAYTYGVLNHFALDMTCHGYIDEKIIASGVSHVEIEVEFDRELMITDHLDPITHNLTHHIHSSIENSKVIKEFYPGTTSQQIQKALRSMIFYNKLLIVPSPVKRTFVNTLLRVTGNYKEMHGLMVNKEASPECGDSTEKLKGLYSIAEQRGVWMIEHFNQFMQEESYCDALFQYTFGSKLIS